MKQKSNPYISIILTGRNDNYGGDFKYRLQRSVAHTFKHLTDLKIESEIIFVNYNPLPSPKIENFIDWPSSNEHVTIRIIDVPPQTHAIIVKEYGVKDIMLLEFIAKNVGIRRAAGQYILLTNADIILHEKIFLIFKSLDKRKYYRANRYDFYSTESYINTEKINNVTRIWLKGFYCDFKTIRNRFIQTSIAKISRYLYYTDYYFKQFCNPIIKLIWGNNYHSKAEMKYHCHCSGDFMLMHKQNWHQLRGYWEGSFETLHVDSLLVVQSVSSGLKEEIIPYPIFHQEHDRRYDHSPENKMYQKEYFYFQSEAQKMLKNKAPKVYNTESWGLINFDLPEKII